MNLQELARVSIRKLKIEDVRCFAGRHEFNIRPLTFLVGENSTGKSTALGCFQTLHNFISARTPGRPLLDFNVEPYQMGAFSNIVRRATPKKKSFTLGFEFESIGGEEKVEYLLTLIERGKGSEPAVQEQKVIFSDSEIVFVDKEREAKWPGRYDSFGRHFSVVDFAKEDGRKKFRLGVLPLFLDMSAFEILGGGFEKLGYRSSIPQEKRKKLPSMEKEISDMDGKQCMGFL